MSKKLGQLLEKMEYELVQGSLDTEVTDLAYDSRKITEGMLFVAIAGTVVDGHKFIPDVLKKGASVIVMERDVKVEDDQVTVVKVKNARAALSYLSAAYFDYPATKMISIGITGTKGKSTTTYMIRDIIEKSGKTCGIVGTIGVAIKGKVTPTEHTTPESYDLQRYFHQMVEAGCDYMVMEVSSQGLKMDRVAGMFFDYGIFTNISPDHIGPNEHKDFAEYLYCKSLLFRMCKVGIFNKDDPKWKELSDACLGCGTCTFSCPTCQCYDIKDFNTGNGVQRYRCWDSCMYSDFTMMAHGNNRNSQMQRFRQRFMHKLVYYPVNNNGMFSCVGCGRCVEKCPSSLNIVKVIKAFENQGGEK